MCMLTVDIYCTRNKTEKFLTVIDSFKNNKPTKPFKYVSYGGKKKHFLTKNIKTKKSGIILHLYKIPLTSDLVKDSRPLGSASTGCGSMLFVLKYMKKI